MKVTGIKPMQKTPEAVAYKQIVDTLRKEKSYEAADELATEVEDQIGSGKTLAEIAESLKTPIHKAKGLGENGNYQQAPAVLPG